MQLENKCHDTSWHGFCISYMTDDCEGIELILEQRRQPVAIVGATVTS